MKVNRDGVNGNDHKTILNMEMEIKQNKNGAKKIMIMK